jgi:hypothetical protein
MYLLGPDMSLERRKNMAISFMGFGLLCSGIAAMFDHFSFNKPNPW